MHIFPTNQGTGEATIREGGLITAENTIIGGNATGIGTLNVQDQDSVITVRRLYNGYFGNGKVNISNNGLINNKEISTDSLWNLKTSSTNAQLLQVGVLGTGELNITTGGIVKARDTQIALNDKSKGDVRVDGQNSRIKLIISP